MKTNAAVKFAVSGLALTITMVACKPAAQAYRPAFASQVAPTRDNKDAATFYAKAQAAVTKKDFAAALPDAEKAVERSPRDSGYRMLLADLYLRNGRFVSAEQTFRDVLSLEPGNLRASLSLALAEIALGRRGDAVQVLDELSHTAEPGDIGLAYALAGQPARAVALLEPAARAANAPARVRQNLALAYALAGDWQKARSTAAQDVSPAELGNRLQQWAALAQPSGAADQVAALLGVRPTVDEGQPVRLALAAPQPAPVLAAAEPVKTAEAAPLPVPVAAPASEPIRVAQADMPAWMTAAEAKAQAVAAVPAPQAAPQPAEVTRPVYADAVQALVTPQPAVIRASAPKLEPIRHFDRPERRTLAAAAPHAAVSGPGRFAVQLGAFSSASSVERAWAQAYKRYGFASHTPLSTTVNMPGRGTFHRLSVAGFASRDEASRICQTVRARGGACFVRAVAGDAPVQWASRYAEPRRG